MHLLEVIYVLLLLHIPTRSEQLFFLRDSFYAVQREGFLRGSNDGNHAVVLFVDDYLCHLILLSAEDGDVQHRCVSWNKGVRQRKNPKSGSCSCCCLVICPNHVNRTCTANRNSGTIVRIRHRTREVDRIVTSPVIREA